MTKNVEKYVDGCNMCQRMKNCIEVLVGKLIANKVLKKLWIYLAVDVVTKLLLVVGKNAILVVCDKMSKMVYVVVTIEGTSAEGLTKFFRDNVWKLHGFPERWSCWYPFIHKQMDRPNEWIRNWNSIFNSLWTIDKRIGQNG